MKKILSLLLLSMVSLFAVGAEMGLCCDDRQKGECEIIVHSNKGRNVTFTTTLTYCSARLPEGCIELFLEDGKWRLNSGVQLTELELELVFLYAKVLHDFHLLEAQLKDLQN